MKITFVIDSFIYRHFAVFPPKGHEGYSFGIIDTIFFNPRYFLDRASAPFAEARIVINDTATDYAFHFTPNFDYSTR